MKYFLMAIFLLLPWARTSAQNKEKIFIFCNADSSLKGVRTAAGKIVIPAKYNAFWWGYGCDEELKSSQILLDSIFSGMDSMGYSYSLKSFDREGNFLYTPLWFDMAPDEYTEGLRRYVKDSKLGFVDRAGKIVIEAQYNFAGPFYRGYAVACLDCIYKKINEDPEHCCGYVGSHYALIDRTGAVVYTGPEDSIYKDQDKLLERLRLLPTYTAIEKKLINQLKQLKEIKTLGRSGDDPDSVYAFVFERPTDSSPFFGISFQVANGSWLQEEFLISADGKSLFHLDYNGNPETLEAWRSRYEY